MKTAKTFEEFLNERGYSWNDFDRTYEMKGLIEEYAAQSKLMHITPPTK